jgi:cell division protein FtsN
LQGFDAKVSEREQSGRTVFRVRIGPLESRDEAERVQQKLVASKIDAALVRVQR